MFKQKPGPLENFDVGLNFFLLNNILYSTSDSILENFCFFYSDQENLRVKIKK